MMKYMVGLVAIAAISSVEGFGGSWGGSSTDLCESEGYLQCVFNLCDSCSKCAPGNPITPVCENCPDECDNCYLYEDCFEDQCQYAPAECKTLEYAECLLCESFGLTSGVCDGCGKFVSCDGFKQCADLSCDKMPQQCEQCNACKPCFGDDDNDEIVNFEEIAGCEPCKECLRCAWYFPCMN